LTSESKESSSEEESSGDENCKCKICDKKKAPQTKNKKGKDTWIGCDVCECWFHVECEGATTKEVQRELYICKNCGGKKIIKT